MSASLAQKIDAILADVFVSLDLPVEFARSVPAARPEHGDRQCNGAMAIAKKLGRNPRDVAGAIVSALQGRSEFAEVSVAGPGFINMRISESLLVQLAAEEAADPDLGLKGSVRDRVVIDFGGPNIAKPLHVGHLRSLVIGETLRRLYCALGYDVISDVHLGDWGLQMGQLITELEIRQPDLCYFDESWTKPYPKESPVSLADLEEMYPVASAACKQDPARLEAARRATRDLQAGRAGYRALWQHFRDISLDAVKLNIAQLGAHFDLFDGESDVDPIIPDMVADLKTRGIAQEDQGATVIMIAQDSDTKPMPPFLLTKSDGAALYATTDLATLKERAERLHAKHIFYVVDQRQAQHFEQVFRAAKKAGYIDGVHVEHVGFGTVNGLDGKPLKTRDGGTVKLSDLLSEAISMAAARIEESEHGQQIPAAERPKLAQQIGIAAIKFADLSSNRLSGYIFDAERLVSFEGKTGPYMQYACVRIASILRNAAEAKQAIGDRVSVSHPAERALALEALRFPEVAASAAQSLLPSEIAEYAYRLAQAFSKFYTECPVLKEPDANIRAGRLALCQFTHQVLSRAMWLLGIEVPKRM